MSNTKSVLYYCLLSYPINYMLMRTLELTQIKPLCGALLLFSPFTVWFSVLLVTGKALMSLSEVISIYLF